MNSKIISQQQQIYRDQFLLHGDGPDATYNQSEIIQRLRFSRLMADFDLREELTIHDVGCGICDLYPYVKKRFPRADYSGTEIVHEMGELAILKYPEIKVFIRDLITEDVPDRYDYVVLSGVFNLPGDVCRDEWYAFVRALLKRMYGMCNKGIAFNFLNAAAADYINPEMYYENSGEMARFCQQNLSRFVRVDQSYPLFEATITVFKPQYINETYDQQALRKYFKN